MFPTIRKRLAMLPILAAAAALALSSVTAPHVRADGGFVDITGKPVHLQAARQDPLNGTTTNTPPPGSAQQLLNTPLSAEFDQLWSGTAAPKICNLLMSKLQGAGGGDFHAYDVSCSLAKAGRLSASQQGEQVLLSYYLPSNLIETSVTTPVTCMPGHGTFLCPDDPRISLTVDVELQATIDAPGPACSLHVDPTATVALHNATLDSQNFSADIAKDVASLWGTITGSDPVTMVDNLVNQAATQQQLPFASQFAALTNAVCNGALSTNGDIWQLTASVDPAQGIVLQLLDVPPTPSLFRATITPAQPTVTAGNTLKIDGQYFPHAGPVTLSIANTQLGTATIAANGSFSTTVTIPAGEAAGSYTVHAQAVGAQADASIQVVVAASKGGQASLAIVGDGRVWTGAEVNSPFTLSGVNFAPGTVTIYLDSQAGPQLGTATAGADGTFLHDFTVSTAQAFGSDGHGSGKHTLIGVQNGAIQAQDAVTFVYPEVIH